MGLEAWIALAVTAGCLVTLIWSRISPDMVFMGGLAVLLVTGVLSPEQALGGFSNTGMLTVAALFVVAAGLRETGALDLIVHRLFGQPRSIAAAQLRLMLPVTFLSAFLNNTPVVASFIPAVSDWAKKQGISVSKLLLPLSYAAIFGGTVTLIGTSTNLVVSGLLQNTPGQQGFSFFELTWVGLPLAITGLLYVSTFSRWLLPARLAAMEQLRDAREYTVEMLIEGPSPLDGQTVEQAGLRNLPGLFLVEVDRDGEIFGPVAPSMVLHAGDRLVFAGVTDSIVDLQRIRGLKPATDQVFKLDTPRASRNLIEAVVSPTSPMVGRSIKAGRFRNRYDAVVIAVARGGRRIRGKIGEIELRGGDTLLIEADPAFIDRHRNSRDFLLLRNIEHASLPRHERSWLAWGVLLGLVALAGFGILPTVTAAILGAGAMVAFRCLGANAARRSIEINVLLVIAAAFGIGKALETSGAAAALAHGLIDLSGGSPIGILIAVYVTTALLTELITNNAAAVLVFPLAYSASQAAGLNFLPFAVAVAMAASASFATPIGYQTNLMVYGPGGYRFTDYLRFGAPMNVLAGIITLTIVPMVWPLQ